jgi:hypothetical protein
VVDDGPTIDRYDTPAQESISLVENSIKITTTTAILNPNILTAQDAEGNTYAFNPNYGWFKVPEVQMDYAKPVEYTEVDQAFIEDSRMELVRAFNYANSPEKINRDAPSVFWVTAHNNAVYLSFFPVGRVNMAEVFWPKEYNLGFHYNKENKPFAFSGFYKVSLKSGGYIYVIDRTIALDNTLSTGLANGFDPSWIEGAASYINPDGITSLQKTLDAVMEGRSDIVNVLLPPDKLLDGTPLTLYPDPGWDNNPVVTGLQGPRGSLISLFAPEDQQRILNVLTAAQHEDSTPEVTAPLTDPSLLAKLANRILLSVFHSP